MFNRKHRNFETCLIVLLSFVFLSATAFGQGANASLTGTVQDSSGRVLPNAAIAVRNVDTGVETRTTSNDRGSYTFPSLQSGIYEISAEASGFSRATRSSVRLSSGVQSRLDFNLSVAGTITEVEVTGMAESVVLEAGASTGTVLQEEMITSIPLLSSNIMDLVSVMGGVTRTEGGGSSYASFAGVGYNQINVVRDGVSVNEVRNPTGVAANTNINTEMIGEFRMVLSPVDAEMGRGAGQVQMTTRSGSNAFHGSGVWNIQNTALDAEDFSVKRTNTPPNWRNLNNYSITASGPIIKNKTFFFATWEQQISREKVVRHTKVLTPCARKGIYRYIGGYVPAARNTTMTYSPSNYTVPSVHEDGRPLDYETGKDITFYNNVNSDLTMRLNSTNTLEIESVFGELESQMRTELLNYKSEDGVYGNCESLAFTPTSEGDYSNAWNQDTSGFYAWKGNSNVLRPNSYWGLNAYRYPYDPTGFVTRFTEGVYEGDRRVVAMPPVNNFDVGDGLNYAAYRWTETMIGQGSSIFGNGGDPDRKSITFKIDHNATANHRLSGTYTYESYYSTNQLGLTNPSGWSEEYGSYSGDLARKPQTLVASLTSTLRPTLLNEFRFALSLSDTWTYDPFEAKNGDKMKEVVEKLMPTSYTRNQLAYIGIGDSPILFHSDPNNWVDQYPSHPVNAPGMISASWGGSDPRWTFSDTVTWMKGAHSFKGGFDYRRQSSTQEYTGVRAFQTMGGLAYMPTIFGGVTESASGRRTNTILNNSMDGFNMSAYGESWRNLAPSSFLVIPGLFALEMGGNTTVPYAMMTYFSGAINQAKQYFYAIPDPNSPTGTGARWSDPTQGERLYSYTLANQEFSAFFKDDWKVTNDLTLNLGVRYEYFGVPHASDGRTLRLGGRNDSSAQNAFGITQGGWDKWMGNRELVYSDGVASQDVFGYLTIPERPDIASWYQYVGPGSPRSDVLAWNRDMNNFAPHIGFSWQLPWFGKGLTTLRGGWSISYTPLDTFNQFGIYIADVAAAGTSLVESFQGLGEQSNPGNTAYYMDLTDLNKYDAADRNVGVLRNNGHLAPSEAVKPMAIPDVGQLYSSATVIDENSRNSYIHSFNLALTRNIGRALTVDVRYIGTMSRNLFITTDLNAPNYFQNDLGYDLFGELEKIRSNDDYQSPLINSLIPKGMLYLDWSGAPPASASDMLRNDATWGYQADLAYGNFNNIVSSYFPGGLVNSNGTVTQRNTSDTGLVGRLGCLPRDRMNPAGAATQDHTENPCLRNTPWNLFVANPQFGGSSLYYGGGMSNYHSMQAQATLRPTRGLSFQVTYTWSRNLSDTGAWTNYLEDRDYTISGMHRSHALNTYGSWELPFGANGFLFRNASGVFKKAIEGWQVSWITSMTSGPPMSITGQNTMWGNNWPVLARPDLWDDKSGKSVWNENFIDGSYFGSAYTKVLDRNICAKNNMASAVYEAQCEGMDLGQFSPTFGQIILRTNAPRALALADPRQPDGVAKYTSVDEALRLDPNYNIQLDENGRPILDIIVFRNADQRNSINGADARGNYKSNRVTGQGRITFDLAMSKSIEFMEGKRFELRVDAQNILNHPTPSGSTYSSYGGRVQTIDEPTGLSINGSGGFGILNTKAGHRTFQARLRLSF